MANIKVAVRVRPISEREIHLTGSEIVVHTEAKTVALTNLKVSSNKAGDSRERTRRYGFDYCFDSSDPRSENYASQEKIYETLGETILDALFKRYNSCLVAYGQSASGKTYTMMGSKEDPGLTPRVCEGLFLRLADEEKSNNGNFNVSVSYLEVYNERVRDLLRPTSNCVGLRVREHPRLGPYVQGLTHHAVSTLGSLISRVEEGTRARKTASTLQNPTSSRSHALLTLSLLPTSDNTGQSGTVVSTTGTSSVPRRNDFPRGSKLHLVDLAGSESATACGGINRLKEGANINKSLVALGNVISALADRGLARSAPGRRFIPYRDSALTWLLKDVLGGNATTVMLATISPASGSYNETSHTLRFAQRAQSVINRPVINEDPVSRIIRELRAEVARLKSLLLEKNININVDSPPGCPNYRDQEEEVKNIERKTPAIDNNEVEEQPEETIEVKQSTIPERRYSASPVSGKKSPTFLKRFSSLENPQDSSGSSWELNSNKYHQAKVSEIFVNDEIDEPVFVDIPTLVAVLIKPDENIQVDSHQIEEICSDSVHEDAIDAELSETTDRHTLPECNISPNCQIDQRQNDDFSPTEVLNNHEFPVNSDVSFETHNQPRVRTKLRKQDSIDSDLSSKRSVNLQSLKKYGSIESLSRKNEILCPIERSHTNLDKRNGSLDKIKKLNNIKEVDDQKLTKLGNSWRNFGNWAANDSQQKVSNNDSDKILKDSCAKLRNQPRKQSIDGLKRKTSKDSSSSSSKDELVTLTRDRTSRKGSLDQEQIPTRIHTPIQRARRAEIVAAVTERLYSSKKIFDDGNSGTTGTTASTPASEVRSPESSDVKLASTTRMRLQEISRKMLAKRRRICVDTQTDNQQTVRVRDTASLTDEPKIIYKDASILTDRHEDYETISSTRSVLRVKEISTITETPKQPIVRCKDVAVVTDDYYDEFPLIIGSPRNDSGIMSDVPNYSGSNLSSAGGSDLCGNFGRRSVESIENSTNTGIPLGSSNSGSQTQREDFSEGRSHFYESRCCGGKYCHASGFNRAEQTHHHTEKNVISISLPDMISITIESANGLESKIKVFDGNEIIDDRVASCLKDNEAQTDAKNALEIGTSTDDIFGQMCFNDFSSSVKPMIAQTDGKSFRIENIFHETGNANRINPRIEIVADSSCNDVKNSLTVTNSVGTFFVPETRENATGMERAVNCSFDEHFGSSSYKKLSGNDSFGKNTWPGQWKSRIGNLRRKSSPASIAEDRRLLSSVSMAPFDSPEKNPCSNLGNEGQSSWINDKVSFREIDLQKDLERRQASKINENGNFSCLKSSSMVDIIDPICVLEQDTNFSDDSLDPMEDGNKKTRDNSNIGTEWNLDNSEVETKGSEKACPPDVVAHTKKDINESSNSSKIVVECEDFEDNQQIVFPKIKLDSTVPINFATPIGDFKSLILGDSCCNVNQADESNFTDLSTSVFRQDTTVSCSDEFVNDTNYRFLSKRSNEPKSIIKKPVEKNTKSDERLKNIESQRNTRKVHFAVPEAFELTSSDSEMCENFASDDDIPDEGNRNILEEYLDEAVVFMRNMNSMNEYMNAACGFEKQTIDERKRRGNKSNYIEYDGRRINLDDVEQTDNSDDEDLNFNAESYEKCLRSMDRLEECLIKVKRHDEILRDNYGIEIGESTGAKLDLAKSSVDSEKSNVAVSDKDENEYFRTKKTLAGRRFNGIRDIIDGKNNNLQNEDKNSTYPSSDDDRGLEALKKSVTRGFCRFSDIRQKEPNTYSQLKGRLSNLADSTKIKKRDDISSFGNDECGKIDESCGKSDVKCLQTSGCCFALPKTKKIVMGLSEGIKSSNSRRRFTLSKYDSSNESSSSNEALESFMESIDNVARSRDKIKYPGSPRSKFLQLLSERRRIVENTRNTGFS